MKNKMKKAWLKVVFLCVLMAVIVAIPASNISAGAATSQRTLLKKTITYCGTMKKAGYTAKTWDAFQKELKNANATYKKKNEKDKVYIKAINELEKSKASLMFVASKKKGSPLTYRKLTVNQIVDEMGAGWNLGNTMDGHSGFTPNETCWQNVITTKGLLKAVHDMGFNTIRVPVTWGTMIDDNNNYAINENWMSRVQDIIDYCISQDMYTIITVFHDGSEQAGWLRVSSEDMDPVYEKYEQVWRQIAERFKDYDEHLIFESMNEVTGGEKSYPDRDMQIIMNMNQIFTNVVRSSGSNNSERWLSVPGRYTNIETTTDASLDFNIPKDTVKNRIFVSVHDYDFAFGLVTTMATTEYSYSSVKYLAKRCQNLVTKFTSKGIPVILGEFGAINKNNTAERAYYCEAFSRICQLDGVVPCVWDQGWYDLSSEKADYSFALVDRNTYKKIYPDIIDAIMRGRFLKSTSDDYSDIINNPTVTKITDFTLSDTALTMTIGDSKKINATLVPSNTNDILLWKTADPRIVSVSNGHVRARGIGDTTLTAFTQSGSVEKTVKITVNKKTVKKPCTSIETGSKSYDLIKGKYVYLNASMKPSDTDDFIIYKSSDETVATVSTIGKVVACSKGTANITITAASGLTKTIKVNVSVDEFSTELALGIYVYYNDASKEFYSNEIGEVIKIDKEGQYSLTFDVSKNLSQGGIAKGVTSINNVAAIYIKDNNVDKGKIIKSPLKSCNIMYDKIVVDGVELTINQKAPKSALKASGIFDTNDPFNGYDGSAVNEVSVEKNILNITGIKSPQKVTITFTLSDLVFADGSK